MDGEYTVRRLQPEDATGVTACVRAIYGDSYVHRELYDPDELRRRNESGDLVSVVALSGGSEVVGHYALEQPRPRGVAESGEAMVLPEHRHHALMERMRALLEEEARARELLGIFGNAVTNHPYTQRTLAHFGERPCAVNLGWSPRSFHNMPDPLPQRLSTLLYFKHLQRPDRATVHAPERHHAVLARLYASLDIPADFRDGAEPRGAARTEVQYREDLQRGTIRVEAIGPDAAGEVLAARATLARGGAEAVFVELPLAQPGAAQVCERLEAGGFFFSGIGPRFAEDGDMLRLQWLGVPLDVSLLQIDGDDAASLVSYVAREKERAGA